MMAVAASSSPFKTINGVRQKDNTTNKYLHQDHSLRVKDQKSGTRTYFLVIMLGPAGAGANGQGGDQ